MRGKLMQMGTRRRTCAFCSGAVVEIGACAPSDTGARSVRMHLLTWCCFSVL